MIGCGVIFIPKADTMVYALITYLYVVEFLYLVLIEPCRLVDLSLSRKFFA